MSILERPSPDNFTLLNLFKAKKNAAAMQRNCAIEMLSMLSNLLHLPHIEKAIIAARKAPMATKTGWLILSLLTAEVACVPQQLSRS